MKSSSKVSVLVSALMAVFGLTAPSSTALAQDKKPVELRYSSGAPPQGNPWVMQINRFAKDVEE